MEAFGPPTSTGAPPPPVDLGDDRSSPLLGRLLDDRYRLDSVVARGGMATVFLGTDTRLDRQVAVKVMHRALADDPEFVARFTREAKASARLSAAEVVAVHDYGTDRTTGLAYLVMEHVRGLNLRQLLLERGALTPARAVSLMEPVLRALAAAHAAGLVHRDVKPENVLLADDGRVKVADFGLARAVETSNLTQTTGLLIGTVAYLAPEQVEAGVADARSDVYAAGVLLWELLTGRPPYSADSPLAVAYRHVHEDMPPPSAAVGGIPPALDELVVRATRRDPAARPANGEEFLAALRQAAAGLPSVAVPVSEHQTLVVPRPAPGTPGPPPGRPAATRRRRGWLPWATALALLAALTLGGGYYLGSYRYTRAPAVVNQTRNQAVATLEQAGLKARESGRAFSDRVPSGSVIEQDPAPGERVRKGGTVSLVVSRGPDLRTVPDLRDKTEEAARKALVAAGLAVDGAVDREYSSQVDEGRVVRTEPPAGRPLRAGTRVTLVVSRGPAPVAVPDVRGKPRDEAVQRLQSLGFKVSVTEVFSDVAKGLVAGQTPVAGTRPVGSTIALSVSKGPDLVTVPDVRGKKAEDAASRIRAVGLVPDIRQVPGSPFDRVLQTDPEPGQRVKRGSTVRLIVY